MEHKDTPLYGIKENSLKRYIIKMTYVGNTSLGLLDSNFEETTSCWDSKKMLTTLKTLDDSYYNGISIVLDATYDRLLHLYESTYKIKYDKIGAPIKGTKVTLPIHMGSMDKVKPGRSELKNILLNIPIQNVLWIN